VERLKTEMAQQEAQWKEAYDLLVSENKMLKSSGSEALLASQWRQRYDILVKEKQDLGNKLKMEQGQKKTETAADAGKYEMKYRDLKESFRLYRKKAKEIFEAQNNGSGSSAQQGVSIYMIYICAFVRMCDYRILFVRKSTDKLPCISIVHPYLSYY
jgi:hypothetical protein